MKLLLLSSYTQLFPIRHRNWWQVPHDLAILYQRVVGASLIDTAAELKPPHEGFRWIYTHLSFLNIG